MAHDDTELDELFDDFFGISSLELPAMMDEHGGMNNDVEDDEEDEEGYSSDDGYEAPSSVATALEAVGITSSRLPVQLSCTDEHDKDYLNVNVDTGTATVRLSQINSLVESGAPFNDMEIPVSFAAMLDSSPFPLQTNREIVDSGSIHRNAAKAELVKSVATWTLVCHLTRVYETAHGRSPPGFELTQEEELTGQIDGKYL